MKKLLSTLSATALIASSTLTVVACGSNANYKDFIKWIDNEESFILYIGADDCTYCQQFETAKKQNETLFQENLDQLTYNYNVSLNNNKNTVDKKTGYGQKLNNDFDFRTFKTEKLEDNFKEKWSKNILNWIIDEATNIYYEIEYANRPAIGQEGTLRKRAHKETKTYFESVKGTPMFILIRNGKLVSWQVGFSEDEIGWNENSFNELFEQFLADVEEPFIDETIAGKIKDGPPTDPETEPDPDPTDPGAESLYKYDKELLNQYSQFYSNI